MSRVRNADEFLLRFRGIRKAYEELFANRIAQIRQKFANQPQEFLLDNTLEAHERTYIVNDFLAALNWRLDARAEDGLPNLFPEAPIRSEERGTVRFLDYFGLEHETDNPLLIVETKRGSALLPRARTLADTRSKIETYSEIVGRGLGGEPLIGEWNTWLKDLGDYVRSAYAQTQRIPKRAVITNGDWLILFLDPADAFLATGNREPDRILVFPDRNDIETRFSELFQHLEHQQVLGQTLSLTPGILPFHLRPDAVDRAMHGMWIRYIEQLGIYQRTPVIKVAPVVFLRSRYGTWLRVEEPPTDYELPHEAGDLVRHLREVQEAAEHLLSEINRQLGIALQPTPLSKHYGDEDGFAAVPGAYEHERDQFLVTTRAKTHYLVPEPSVLGCPYHDWAKCKSARVASNPGPVMTRSISPRSFFVSAELHHCAHPVVDSAKASQITSSNRDRCGTRSGHDGQAFCEIWRFEQHLCCRTCAFEEVCTKAEVFRLPCQRTGDRANVETAPSLREQGHTP